MVVALVSFATVSLVYQASKASAKMVVTVEELVREEKPRPSIRLGARVTRDPIEYETNPALKLEFFVRDIEEDASQDSGKDSSNLTSEKNLETVSANASAIKVIYKGIRPDTLQPGRDVILEGDFDGTTFEASVLMTQCPSKYEPPSMGDSAKSSASSGQEKASQAY